MALASVASASCGFDASDSCNSDQTYETGKGIIDYGVCVCDEARGYIFDVQRGTGCKQCAEGQVAMDGRCVAPAVDAGSEQTDAQTDSSMDTQATGTGEPCTSAADCAGFDATYCAPVLNTCFVDKCATGENECPSMTTCCDYSALLAGLSLCVSPDLLEDGDCPMGGMKVEP